MTRHIHAHLFICLLALIGCSKSQDSDNTESKKAPTQSNTNIVASIAVINLDTVAIELGATSLVEKLVDQKEKDLNQEIFLLRDGHQNELEKMEQRFGANPTTEQLAELNKLKENQAISLQKKLRECQLDLLQFQNQKNSQFMEEVKPIAYKKARERGLSIVLSTGQFYAADKQVDITDDVIKEIKHINENAFKQQPSDNDGRSVRVPDGGKFQPRF